VCLLEELQTRAFQLFAASVCPCLLSVPFMMGERPGENGHMEAPAFGLGIILAYGGIFMWLGALVCLILSFLRGLGPKAPAVEEDESTPG
jgi:hypothetical protein